MPTQQATGRTLELYVRAATAYALTTTRLRRLRPEGWDERGEGVISTAIAVLIMAVIGVAAYLGWQAIFDDTSSRVENQVNQIG